MAGMKFEYDESGSLVLYFLVSFLGLVLVPATYFFWPNPADQKKKRSASSCSCEPCLIKEEILKKKEPKKKLKRFLIRLALVIGWLLFLFFAYKITETDYEYANFDPYEILGIDLSASSSQIKRAYRKLSLIYHPDKETGDEKKFMKLTKAYQALTDETARRNWEKYGNPDGPGAMSFGIALPSWIVEKENSIWVLGLYAMVFMIALPVTVGVWWYRSIQYSGDKILLDTSQLYYYFYHKSPSMPLKRVIMVLGSSMEFAKQQNSEVKERQSDHFELPQLIKQLPNLNEKNKERPLCFFYSIKARALIHAHLSRIPLNKDTFELDRQLVVKKCPYLIQEMVSCVSQLIILAHAGRVPKLPTLDSVENTMKLSPMIVQALWALDSKSALLQLPHVTEDMQKYFASKKRHISTIHQFCSMKEEDRRSVFKILPDNKYEDIMKVCASMPLIEFEVDCEVLDDEESKVVTAGAIVTVTINLTRKNMSSLIKSSKTETPQKEEDENKENSEGEGDRQSQPKKPVWQKKKGGKKGSNKKPHQRKSQPLSNKQTKKQGSTEDDLEKNSDGEIDGEERNFSDSESETETKEKERDVSAEQDDAEWEKCQSKLAKSKERALEGKSKISHPVHCPYYPAVKQEHWWTYVCDKKRERLITNPYLVTDLVTTQECQLQFTAPGKPGIHKYIVCLRSDSYVGFDQQKEIKLDVQPPKEIDELPQWDIPDEDDEKESDVEGSEYASDEDIDDYEEDETSDN